MRTFLKRENGQAMVEYLVLYTAILTAFIVFLGSKTSFFGRSFNGTLYRATNSIIVVTNRILQ